MVALFENLHGEKKFEASDVIPVGSDFLVVFDNCTHDTTTETETDTHDTPRD